MRDKNCLQVEKTLLKHALVLITSKNVPTIRENGISNTKIEREMKQISV